MNGVEPFSADVAERGGYVYTTDARLSSRLANERMSQIALELTPLSGKRVIDIGCGDGAYTLELARRGAPRSVEGIDPSEGAIEVARGRARGVDGVSFSAGSAYELPHEPGAFDVAQLRGVLHHVERPRDALREAFRVARTVVVIEPNGYNPGLKVLERVSPYHREHEERSYAPRRLDRWVGELGGRVIAHRFVGFVPMFSPDAYARLAKRIEPVLESIPLLRALACAQYAFAADGPAAR
jgi:ubiquinone/menaquinone biosynthesis C-methylase UbiE